MLAWPGKNSKKLQVAYRKSRWSRNDNSLGSHLLFLRTNIGTLTYKYTHTNTCYICIYSFCVYLRFHTLTNNAARGYNRITDRMQLRCTAGEQLPSRDKIYLDYIKFNIIGECSLVNINRQKFIMSLNKSLIHNYNLIFWILLSALNTATRKLLDKSESVDP